MDEPVLTPYAWQQSIRELYQNKCCNCGSPNKTSARQVVPEEAGGRLTKSNGVLICRACEMMTATVKNQGKKHDRRLVNFWVSQRLYDAVKESVSSNTGFSSMGGLVRYLIDCFDKNPDLFEDMLSYQDSTGTVKINVWVDVEAYSTFRTLVKDRKMTVTEALKALLLLYNFEARKFLDEH